LGGVAQALETFFWHGSINDHVDCVCDDNHNKGPDKNFGVAHHYSNMRSMPARCQRRSKTATLKRAHYPPRPR
jgi:hypothetical protein